VGRTAVLVALYLAVSAAWIYRALDSEDGLNQLGENDRMFVITIAVLGFLHLAYGYLVARWWVVLLPAALVALAIPAGDFPSSRPEYPIWFGLAMLAPLLVVLAGLGLGARRIRRSS
jgi:hypothetical protein